MNEADIKCTVLGSFRFKKEIDSVIQEFEDYGVKVLAPEKGQVFRPKALHRIQINQSFQPLVHERQQPIRFIEDSFLGSVARSDLIYLVNIDGYVGPVVNVEMGFVIARDIPLYSMQPINTKLDPDPYWQKEMQKIKVRTVREAVDEFKRTL